MSTWTLARSLAILRNEINAAYPDRSRLSDGTIGDARHSSTTSDHNPDSLGVVRAMDITAWVSPDGTNIATDLAEFLRRSRDRRIKYVIHNRRIFSSTIQPWVWRPYDGSSPHTSHVHISVNPYPVGDDDSPWHFHEPASPPHAPTVKDDDMPLLFARADDTNRVFQIVETDLGQRSVYVPDPLILNEDLAAGATLIEYATVTELAAEFPLSKAIRVVH